ncbi:MAG TPA: response regulator, partial [Steroidobacteraceae bacterium]|nr:response regulator [Steroidobacteraceae bacterium]
TAWDCVTDSRNESEEVVMTPLAHIAMAASYEPVSEAPASVCRVLIVDDDHNTADTLGALLTSEGHFAKAAYSGSSAVALFAEFKPHVVVLHLGMPQLNGYETLRRMKAARTQARFVAMSSFGGATDRRLALSTGFDAYLVKPLSLEALNREIYFADV